MATITGAQGYEGLNLELCYVVVRIVWARDYRAHRQTLKDSDPFADADSAWAWR